MQTTILKTLASDGSPTYQARFWFYTWQPFSEGLYCKVGEDTFNNIDDCKKFIELTTNKEKPKAECIKYP